MTTAATFTHNGQSAPPTPTARFGGSSHEQNPGPHGLPPIRDHLPDFFSNQRQPTEPGPGATSTVPSPVGAFERNGNMSPTYTHSPNQAKRKRSPDEEVREESHVPRRYPSPSRGLVSRRPLSPRVHYRALGGDWNGPRPWRSAYGSQNIPGMEAARRHLPPVPQSVANARNLSYRHAAPTGHSADHGPSTMPPAYQFPAPTEYPLMGYHEHMRYAELTGMGLPAELNRMGLQEPKPRKRRGNLPKEMTDKLKAWFYSHLHHPYPTDEEKQVLMEQTGLQLNQISNWFINARRRQLPTMISNARAESEVMSSARGGSSSSGGGGSADEGGGAKIGTTAALMTPEQFGDLRNLESNIKQQHKSPRLRAISDSGIPNHPRSIYQDGPLANSGMLRA